MTFWMGAVCDMKLFIDSNGGGVRKHLVFIWLMATSGV